MIYNSKIDEFLLLGFFITLLSSYHVHSELRFRNFTTAKSVQNCSTLQWNCLHTPDIIRQAEKQEIHRRNVVLSQWKPWIEVSSFCKATCNSVCNNTFLHASKVQFSHNLVVLYTPLYENIKSGVDAAMITDYKALTGAGLFVLSDLLIGLRPLVTLPLHDATILIAYYTAQFFITSWTLKWKT